MTVRRPARLLGWTAAGAVAAAILSSAALALVAERRPEPTIAFEIALEPPSALTVGAVADPAPVAVDEAPDLAETAAPIETALPDLPVEDEAPPRLLAAPILLPAPEVPVLTDLVVPTPEPVPAEPEPEVKPKPKPEKPETKKPETKKADTKKAEAKPRESQKKPDAPEKEKATASAGATAPEAGARASGGAKVSPAAYAKAVMKKVRATRKQSGAGKGTALIGFSIGKDGGLAAVKVLRSSGNASLDAIAVDHIRRSAPFPQPPEGADRNFSFEFVGK